MHFKKNNYSVSTKLLCEELNLSEEDLETHYEYLIKIGLINKKNGELLLNELFFSENEKINLNYRGLIAGKKKSEENTKEISHFVLEDNYLATVGFEFFNFNIKLGERVIRLQIWDTCGQEIYRSLITNFYRNSSLAFIVFAVDE